MSDIRDELARAIQGERERWADGRYVSNVEIAAAILEGFDVTPKPVISEQELGRMVRSMADDINHPAVSSVSLGADLRDALDRRGLEIVRKKVGK